MKNDVVLSGKTDWFRDASIYHIYPLGLCGAYEDNDVTMDVWENMYHIDGIIPHIKEMGFTAVYFGPIFQSDFHGYDTIDYCMIDRRIGTTEQFIEVCKKLHREGIRIIVDGVFNHVGRGNAAFQDVIKNRKNSKYYDWFYIKEEPDREDYFKDGLFYEGWNDNFEIVKMNTHNKEVQQYLFDCIEFWIDTLGIDGIRLDAADCLDMDLVYKMTEFCKKRKKDIFLVGEVVHGDYNQWAGENRLDSITNYQLYDAFHRSFNLKNLRIFAKEVSGQFSPSRGYYNHLPLYTFLDNHDISRIATKLEDTSLLRAVYGLLYTVPGIPTVYYGSEFAMEGIKEPDDDHIIRPEIEPKDLKQLYCPFTDFVKRLNQIHHNSMALCRGSYEQLHVDSGAIAFIRKYETEQVICAVNILDQPKQVHIHYEGKAKELIRDESVMIHKTITIPAKDVVCYVIEE